jgi:hypothetical protein
MKPSISRSQGRLTAIVPALVFGAAITGMSDSPFADDDYRHVVQAGDTVISIGAKVLQEPRDWVRIVRHNRIPNPNHLRPGSTLLIPVALLRREAAEAQITAVQGEVRADGTPLAVGDRIGQGRELTSDRD